MDKQELTGLLAKLQTELESGQAVDEQLRQQLLALDQDIQKVLAKRADPTSGAVDASLSQRATEIEARFASEHPYLASTLRDVMDTLGKMGI